MSLSQAQGFIFGGDVYFAPIAADGTVGGLRDVGNTTKFSIKSNSTIKTQKSKKRDSYGQDLETVALLDSADVSATIETVNRDNLRYSWMGEDIAYSQTEATVTSEVIVMRLDGYAELANEEIDLTQPFLLKDSTGTTTYVKDVDYAVLPRLGWVQALDGGDITDLQSCKATYKHKAFTGAAIRGNVQPQLRVKVVIDGVNKVDDSIGIMRAHEAVLTPDAEFDFFSDDWNSISLSGKLKTPPGQAEPFTYYQR